jgi:transcription initiation factor TFIID TATA-box-binding protein
MNLSVRVVNVVATATLDQTADVESLPRIFPNEAIHDDEIYGGRVAYFKSKAMNGKAIIFPSGKMISVGTTTPEEAIRELNHVAETLKVGLKHEPKIRNIVATVDLGEPVDLEEASARLRAIYEPEQFPGAILRLEEPKATILIFSSGKCVITGTKSESSLNQAVRKLSQILSAPEE